MNKNKDLLWRKAAALGSLWAASEIVLGSFLKNTHIPLAGLLLTGIGAAILTAGRRLWPERGLLWRAGLICAAMKSVSPSAVLLSPMVAIFMEGLLMEAATALLGGNAAGCLLAGGLAMSWGLVHKIGKLYLFYGPGALEVYARGLEKLRAWLGQPGGAWEPLLVLLGLHFAAGLAAAGLGLLAGRPGGLVPAAGRASSFRPRQAGQARFHSGAFLFFHLAALAALMAPARETAAWLQACAGPVYGLACAASYQRALALLRRGGLWGWTAAVSLLAGYILGDWGAGARMAARAFALSLGFAAVGEELLNPAVRARIEGLTGGVFFDALETAFSSLPRVLSALPSGRDLLTRPAASLRTAVALAPALLEEMEKSDNKKTGAP